MSAEEQGQTLDDAFKDAPTSQPEASPNPNNPPQKLSKKPNRSHRAAPAEGLETDADKWRYA
jgi:hypothetical protein